MSGSIRLGLNMVWLLVHDKDSFLAHVIGAHTYGASKLLQNPILARNCSAALVKTDTENGSHPSPVWAKSVNKFIISICLYFTSFFSFLCLFWSTLSLFCSGWPRTHPCSASASASWMLILWHGGIDDHARQFIYYKCMGMFEPRSRLYSLKLPQEEEHEAFEISPWRGSEGPKTTQAIPTAVGCPPELDAKACCWRHHMLWAQDTGKSFGTGLEVSSLLVGPRRPKRCCVGCGRELLPTASLIVVLGAADQRKLMAGRSETWVGKLLQLFC